jgi:two-component system, chemotaxis family, protein-glutamate methylesterase/glutaminase
MKTRVIIVDDSATMRAVIAAHLRVDPEIEVVGQAADPHEARQLIKAFMPDVITLDIEMPNMDGISFLEKIMRLRPTPVIMISTLTQTGADISLRALEIGAFDCVAKPSSISPGSFSLLAEKVKAAAQYGCKPRLVKVPTSRPPFVNYEPNGRLIAIGSSTGGVEALIEILSKFPENCAPVVISQHMPATFTKSFAARLNKLCKPVVGEAVDGQKLEVGHVYLAPGDCHLELVGRMSPEIRLSHGDKVNGHRPSVDVMFRSVANRVGSRAVAAILTGLGNDGAEGMLALRQVGAETFGQDEASCVVYGMPRAAFELGAVDRQVPLEKMAAQLLAATAVFQKVSAI